MADFTPGPWSFDGPTHSIIVWGPEPEQRVCFMTSDGPARANARLIVAAPDMLVALTECARVLYDRIPNLGPEGATTAAEHREYEEVGGAWSMADRAIAKARGESRTLDHGSL